MDLNKIAKLANLPLSQQQSQELPSQMERIINYVSKLTANTQNTTGKSASDLVNITRADEISVTAIKTGTYIVPAVIDES